MRRPTGFTLIETLVAVALLAFLVVGILPLFVRSMRSNAEGREMSELTNRARGRAEELLEIPFDSPDLTVPDGADELLRAEHWSEVEERWILEADFPAEETPRYTRTTRVRQFGSRAVGDGDVAFEDAEVLPGGTEPALVNVKEIEVHVTTGGAAEAGVLGPRRTAVLRLLRSS